WGDVEVPVDGSVSIVKNLFVENKGASTVTYNVTYQDVTPVAGANFTVPSTLTVGAGSNATVPITFSATGNLLKHRRETSVSSNDPNFGLHRQWLTEKGGYIVLTPTGGSEPTIRVALYAAPKP